MTPQIKWKCRVAVTLLFPVHFQGMWKLCAGKRNVGMMFSCSLSDCIFVVAHNLVTVILYFTFFKKNVFIFKY